MFGFKMQMQKVTKLGIVQKCVNFSTINNHPARAEEQSQVSQAQKQASEDQGTLNNPVTRSMYVFK